MDSTGRAPSSSNPVPGSQAAPKTLAPVPPASVGLSLGDSAGHLQNRWERAAPAVQAASRGTIEINDGKDLAVVPLDRKRLDAGSFFYARRSESVDVRLSLELGEGGRVQEVATFFGKLPDQPAAIPEGDEAEKLRADLKAQTERARKLERSVEDMRKQIKRDQQRRRLENQATDPLE
jgi:hypothetical protein